jgi:Cys-rich repeat protein
MRARRLVPIAASLLLPALGCAKAAESTSTTEGIGGFAGTPSADASDVSTGADASEGGDVSSGADASEGGDVSSGGDAGKGPDAPGDTGKPADAPTDKPVVSDAPADAAGDPCAGVVCNTPPPNACADPSTLTVYNATGTCDKGTCGYGSTPTPCPNGCSAGKCNGDPCIGITCKTPPANYCADTTHLAVYDVPGTCSGGNCSYATHSEYCQFGCQANVCNGDPCKGVSCNSPPANYCADASNLTVNEVPGTCSGGVCSYKTHAEYCQFGCAAGQCKGDPCVGVTCKTPPADYCVTSGSLHKFDATGQCSGGNCVYGATDVPCPHGCAGGVCKDCQTTPDCGAGTWCNNGTCIPCNTDLHCGSACTNCSAASQVCNVAGTACVQCVVNSHCGGGKWCNAGTCALCNTDAHCGASCVACSGQTPTCNGTTCVCSASSCGANYQCVAGACALCKSDAACGAACTACGGATPKCLDQGTSSTCVQCLTNGDCVSPKLCNASHACVDPGCPPPVESCTTGTQNRRKCTGARIIGRKPASTGAGYAISDDTCYAYDDFNDNTSCWDANSDHAYRIYMRKNESVTITLSTGWDCPMNWSYWNATLKIFSNAGCADTSCATKVFCAYNNDSYNKVFTAPQDGWYIIVVDGSSAFDDEGDYDFGVKLTCKVAGCECP